MKLLTFSNEENTVPKLGAYIGGTAVIDMPMAYHHCYKGHAPDWFGSVYDLLGGGDRALDLARELLSNIENDKNDADDKPYICNADEIHYYSPASPFAKILCVTMNYLSHAASSSVQPPKEPYFFIKMPNLMTPHRSHILLSKTSKKCDSEIELGIIIGKAGKYISRKDAFDHVAGYTICNDFSFRDRKNLKFDPDSPRLHWFTLKNLDTAAPIGPWLVTKDEIPDPYDLDITLTLDNDPDERMAGSTSGMLHKIPELIEHASDGLTLEPGDVICTGTPLDVAFGHKRFLKEGDILRAEISGIGALVNPVEKED